MSCHWRARHNKLVAPNLPHIFICVSEIIILIQGSFSSGIISRLWGLEGVKLIATALGCCLMPLQIPAGEVKGL